jgi:hypothetical protein
MRRRNRARERRKLLAGSDSQRSHDHLRRSFFEMGEGYGSCLSVALRELLFF